MPTGLLVAGAAPGRLHLRGHTGFGGAVLLLPVLGSVGPLMAPFFLADRLLKSTYIGTKAACTHVMRTTKLAVYDGGGVLTNSAVMTGLALAPPDGHRRVDR